MLLQPPLNSDFLVSTQAGKYVSPTLKVYEDENVQIVDGVCLQVVHKGSQSRLAQPFMSENIKLTKSFLPAVDDICKVKAPIIYYGLFIDIWHGQYPNKWSDLCHWCDTFFNLMSAARLNVFESLTHIFMWQVQRSQWKEHEFHNAILNSVLEASNTQNITLVFDEDIKNGSFWFFQRIAASRFIPRKLSQYSTHFTGCSRGFKHVSDRLFYRNMLMSRYQFKESKIKSVLYLQRPRVLLENEDSLKRYVESKKYVWKQYTFTKKIPFREQFKQVSTSRIMISSHGANMVYMVFMPRFSAVVEILNCKYHSFMYGNLAMNSNIFHSQVYASDVCSNVSNTINTRMFMNNRIKISTQRFYNAIDFSTRYVNFALKYEKTLE